MHKALNTDCEMEQVLSLSMQRLAFRPVSFHVKLVEDEEAMGKTLSPSTSVFPCSLSHHCSILIFLFMHHKFYIILAVVSVVK